MKGRRRTSDEASERRLAFVRAVGDIDPRLELDAFLQRVADVALAVGVASAVVAVHAGDGWRIVHAGEPYPDAESTASRIAAGESPGGQVFGVPLASRGGAVGAMWVVAPEGLSGEERALVSSLAELVSAAAADATLFASQQEAEERTRRYERLEAGFASMVSHELRSPLATIRGFGRLLLDREDSISAAERREFLEVVLRQADRMASLVDDVLDAAQIEAGAFQCTFAPYDPDALLRQCVAETAAAYPDHPLRLATGSLPEARGDVARLEQAILNVLANACRYSPAGEAIDVSATAGEALDISITDRGSGIAAEDLDQIFTRFGRLANEQTRKVQGAGLGLYITRQIVELHGGRIWATSEPGRGATFHFSIPLEGPPNRSA